MTSSAFKKIGIVVLVLVLLLGVAIGWMWHRITALPSWYEQGEMVAEDGQLRVDEAWVQVPETEPPAGAPEGAQVYVIRNPHVRAEPETDNPMTKAIKQSRAAYAGGRMDAGAVLNLSDADLDSLDADARARYEETIEAFPALTERDVYVGVEGDVEERDGRLVLGPDAELRVGDSRYSIATAARRLGMSEAELRDAIEDELANMAVELPDR